MSTQVTEAQVREYAGNVQLLLQQQGSVLADKVGTGTHVGSGAVPADQVGSVTAVRRTTRHADTPLVNTPHARRWVFPVDYEVADLLDHQDMMRLLADMKGPYAQSQAFALGRAKDSEIITADRKSTRLNSSHSQIS